METAWISNCYTGYMGRHLCTICAAEGRGEWLRLSAINIFVPGDMCVYVFPACIFHYIDEHGYRPPLTFCKAVLSCQHLTGSEYRATLVETNRAPIPLDDACPGPTAPLHI